MISYVRVATTSPIALNNTTTTVDGVTLANGNWVLVKDQTSALQNGVYVVSSDPQWPRVATFSSWDEFVGASVVVRVGTVNAGRLWACTALPNDGIVDSKAIIWVLAGVAPLRTVLTRADLALIEPDSSESCVVVQRWDAGSNDSFSRYRRQTTAPQTITTSGTSKITSTSGSSIYKVFITGNGLLKGEMLSLATNQTVGGRTLNGDYHVTRINPNVDPDGGYIETGDTFFVDVGVAATSSETKTEGLSGFAFTTCTRFLPRIGPLSARDSNDDWWVYDETTLSSWAAGARCDYESGTGTDDTMAYTRVFHHARLNPTPTSGSIRAGWKVRFDPGTSLIAGSIDGTWLNVMPLAVDGAGCILVGRGAGNITMDFTRSSRHYFENLRIDGEAPGVSAHGPPDILFLTAAYEPNEASREMVFKRCTFGGWSRFAAFAAVFSDLLSQDDCVFQNLNDGMVTTTGEPGSLVASISGHTFGALYTSYVLFDWWKIIQSAHLDSQLTTHEGHTVAQSRRTNCQYLRQNNDVVDVNAATTQNLAFLSGLQTVDTVVLVAGDYVLVKDQSSNIDNGIYVAAAGEWQRARDAANNELWQKALVCGGTANRFKAFLCTAVSPNVGESPLPYVEVVGGAAAAYGWGLVQSEGWAFDGCFTTSRAGNFMVAGSAGEVGPGTLHLHLEGGAARLPKSWLTLFPLPRQITVQAATTSTDGNIPLSGLTNPLTGLPKVDGVTLTAGMVVLLNNQTAAAQNGIWIASSNNWNRHPSWATGGAFPNSEMYVQSGAENGNAYFRCTNTSTPDVGTTSINFAPEAVIQGVPIDLDVKSVVATEAAGYAQNGFFDVTATNLRTVTFTGGSITLNRNTTIPPGRFFSNPEKVYLQNEVSLPNLDLLGAVAAFPTIFHSTLIEGGARDTILHSPRVIRSLGQLRETFLYCQAAGVAPTDGFAAACDALFWGLMNDSLWEKTGLLLLFASPNSRAATINAVAPYASRATLYGNGFTANQGFTGNSGESRWIDTGRTPLQIFGGYQRNSAHFGLWIRTGSGTGVAVSVASGTGAAMIMLNPHDGGADLNARINMTDYPEYSGAVAARSGHFLISRTSSTASAAYRNATQLGTQSYSSQDPAGQAATIAILRHGTAYVEDQVSIFHGGASLNGTEVTSYYTRLNTFMAAL